MVRIRAFAMPGLLMLLAAAPGAAQPLVVVRIGPRPVVVRPPLGPPEIRQTPAGPVVVRQSPIGPIIVHAPFPRPSGRGPFVLGSSAQPAATAATTSTAMKISSIEDGPARNAGLKADDIIVKVDGKRIRTFEELRSALTASNGKSIFVVFTPGAEGVRTVDVDVTDTKIGAGVVEVPVEYDDTTRENGLAVKSVQAGGASAAGIAVGDVILAVDDKRVTTDVELRAAIAASKGQSQVVVFKKATGKVETVPVTVTNGLIGVTVDPVPIEVEK